MRDLSTKKSKIRYFQNPGTVKIVFKPELPGWYSHASRRWTKNLPNLSPGDYVSFTSLDFWWWLIDHWWHFHNVIINDQTKIRLEDYSLVYQLFQKLQSWPPADSQYSFLQCDSIMMEYKSYHKTSSTMQKNFHQTFLNPFIGLPLWTMKQKYTGIFLIQIC